MSRLNHPSAAALEAFLHRRLTSEGVRAVVTHLLRGCRRCQRIAARLAAGMLFPPSKDVPHEDLQFDHAIESAWAEVVQEYGFELAAQYDPPEEEEQETPQEIQARVERELAESYRHRYSDPAKMVSHAETALRMVLFELHEEDYPPEAYRDLLDRALGELGNAHRVANHFDLAEEVFKTALASITSSEHLNELLLARLLDLQASLFRAQRKFRLCFRNLDRVYSLYMNLGDFHLAGRALIKTGIAKGYAGQPEEAVKLLRRGLARLDAKRDPGLVATSVHSLISFMVAAGQFLEGEKLLEEQRALLLGPDEPLNLLKVRWIEGRIAAGLGNVAEAETAFEEVRAGFAEHRLPDQAAVATLDLALVWLGEGRVSEIAELAAESVKIFESLGICREAIASLLVLQEAARQERLTLALAQRISTRLRELEHQPQPKF